jgi:hypothetical protein
LNGPEGATEVANPMAEKLLSRELTEKIRTYWRRTALYSALTLPILCRWKGQSDNAITAGQEEGPGLPQKERSVSQGLGLLLGGVARGTSREAM